MRTQDCEQSDALPPQARPPRTLTVLILLAAAALIFSYLGSYALAGALVDAEVLSPWTPDQDPRPRWLLGGFVILMFLFLSLGALFRWLSRRQLRAIDAMETDE
jgi:uncharacterized BrkB/YihY/UPF0761 family membrane protein